MKTKRALFVIFILLFEAWLAFGDDSRAPGHPDAPPARGTAQWLCNYVSVFFCPAPTLVNLNPKPKPVAHPQDAPPKDARQK